MTRWGLVPLDVWGTACVCTGKSASMAAARSVVADAMAPGLSSGLKLTKRALT